MDRKLEVQAVPMVGDGGWGSRDWAEVQNKLMRGDMDLLVHWTQK